MRRIEIPPGAIMLTEENRNGETYCYDCRNYTLHVHTHQRYNDGWNMAWSKCVRCKNKQHQTIWREV